MPSMAQRKNSRSLSWSAANTALLRAGPMRWRASNAIKAKGPPLPPGVVQMANSVAMITPRLRMRPRCSP
ncbi:hypothetical protein D3C84_853280 [compost metagenome]